MQVWRPNEEGVTARNPEERSGQAGKEGAGEARVAAGAQRRERDARGPRQRGGAGRPGNAPEGFRGPAGASPRGCRLRRRRQWRRRRCAKRAGVAAATAAPGRAAGGGRGRRR